MRSKLGDGRGHLWGALTYAGISLSTLTWVPVIDRGGTLIELPNLIQLIFIALLPAVLLFSRPAPSVHLLFLLLMGWVLVMLLALALHGSPGGSGYVRQQMPQTLFGWSLALCVANSQVRISRVAVVSLVILFAVLEFSAIRAGASALVGAFDFVTTLDRTTFIFRVLRPAINVFVHQEGDLVYVASQLNNVANMIVLLGCLAFFSSVEETRRSLRLIGTTIATLALIFAFILFSSSAVLVMALFAVVLTVQVAMRLPSHLRNLALLALLTLAIVLFEPVSRFMEANLTEDEVSRSVRVEQAKSAIRAIDSSLLTGVGYFDVGGHVIHNWMLFSWATSGVVAFLLVIGVYGALASAAIRLIRAVPWGAPTVVALVTLFVVRTSVGGAGGIPSGPAIIAAALVTGLMVRHARPAVRRPLPLGVARSHP